MSAAQIPGARVTLTPEFIAARDTPTRAPQEPEPEAAECSTISGQQSPAARAWSSMQQAIFTWVGDAADRPVVQDAQHRHLVIEALAGSGKSTTIVEALRHIYDDQRAIFLAFNKEIADAIRPRVPQGVEVATCHSYANRALRRAFGPQELAKFACADRVQARMGRAYDTRALRGGVCKLISIAKGLLLDPADLAGLDQAADAYSIDLPQHYLWSRPKCLQVASDVLRATLDEAGGPYDFDDMIWLPLMLQLPLQGADWVFVDETQDLNPAQLEMIKRIAGERGRIVAVGDRRQSIYGFRGADREAIPRMIRELSADVLPLSVTYRCPPAIVKEAQELVPQLESGVKDRDGIVRDATIDELRREAQPGDFVISRVNAPLVSLCFKWLSAGRRATIRGRDLASGLSTWVQGTKATTIDDLARCLREWRQGEVERLTRAERDCGAIIDRAECLEALMAGARGVPEVQERITRLFDGPEGGAIVLTSTHRAKGLEADRVWLLADTYMRWPGEEEANLLYVAITRAKRELVYCYEDQKEQS